jgi:hypothetical protein
VHFTRGASADEAAPARERARGLESMSHLEFMQLVTGGDQSGFYSSLSILWQGHIRPTGYALGAAQHVAQAADRQRAACFSESPLDQLATLIESRSRYGVGFTQDFLAKHGGGKVRYLDPDSAQANAYARRVDACAVKDPEGSDALWAKTVFVDIVDPGRDMRWEQEWRVPGRLDFQSARVTAKPARTRRPGGC